MKCSKLILATYFISFSGMIFSLILWTNNYFSIYSQYPDLPIDDFSTSFSELPILDYCELANNQEKYDGKIIRVNSKLYEYIPNPAFLNENCKGLETVVLFNEKDFNAILDRTSIDIIHSHKAEDLWFAMPKIIAVGKFSKNELSENDEKLQDFKFRFEVINLEKVNEP